MLRTGWLLTLVLAVQPSGAYRSGANAALVDGLSERGCALRDRAQYAQAEALLRNALALPREPALDRPLESTKARPAPRGTSPSSLIWTLAREGPGTRSELRGIAG